MTTHYGSGSAGTARNGYRATPPGRPSAFWNDHTNDMRDPTYRAAYLHHTAATERHTMTSPAELLDQLDAAREKATPGPWRMSDDANVYREGEPIAAGPWGGDVGLADAALIVAAVNHLPALTSALRAVLALADSLDVDSCDPMPDDRSRLMFETANRIRTAVVSALAGDHTNQKGATL